MQQQIHDLLVEMGEDPSREGLIDTPARVEKSLRYLTRGYTQTLEKVVNGALFEAEKRRLRKARKRFCFAMFSKSRLATQVT